ncbi:hypothetical protein GCM10009651_11360 [Microbacterium natoriense]|uniref:DUF5615 family PIN-like protein n=1 Tax=Microbacterium TaxID=33882 RepID=UPI000CFAE76D|nr:DUF5615 family PIN-like protein [Microbacterium sp. MYb72]PRB03136.1 hypothetical protein CQ047_17635 [Microbacterium sp. MYb72]
MTPPDIRLLLDEHYPSRLAASLREAGLDATAIVERAEMLGVDDTSVLRAANGEGRIVVTEDVTTFGIAMARLPDHAGVVFCHHARFPRTRPGLERLRRSLLAFAADPPPGIGRPGFVWWLSS